MGLLDLFRRKDINIKLQEAIEIPGAVILDVRNADEFRQGYIPGAINIPLENISKAGKKIERKDTPAFSYCLMGTRSARAVTALKNMGYTNVTNIGGISRYKGKLER